MCITLVVLVVIVVHGSKLNPPPSRACMPMFLSSIGIFVVLEDPRN